MAREQKVRRKKRVFFLKMLKKKKKERKKKKKQKAAGEGALNKRICKQSPQCTLLVFCYLAPRLFCLQTVGE